MSVPLGSTWAEIIKAINEGGGGIPKLTTQTVAIADLDAGVYIWDYNGEKTLDYYSGTKQIYQNPTLVQISSNGDTQKDFYLFDNKYGADENLQELIWGAIYINSETGEADEGFCLSRFLYDLPSRNENNEVGYFGYDPFKIETPNPITLNTHYIQLYAPQDNGAIEILAGTEDNTYFFISPFGIDATANTGFVNFSASDHIGFSSNSGSVDFYADNSMSFHAEYGDIVFESSCFFESTTTFESDVNFDGNVDFSNATIKGLGFDTNDVVTLTGVQVISGNKTFTGSNNSFSTRPKVGNTDVALVSDLEGLGGEIDTSADIHWTGDHSFEGTVDFSDANVTGLNVSGGGKTKITVAELKSMVANYSSNRGKIIQLVSKSTNTYDNIAIQAVGLFTIQNTNVISKSVGSTGASQSAINGSSYFLYINSTSAYIRTDSWDYDIENAVTNTNTSTLSLTDTNCDIYVIGE